MVHHRTSVRCIMGLVRWFYSKPSITKETFTNMVSLSIPTWISNHIHNNKEGGEVTYPFPNFNVAATEVWKWISSFILHFTGHAITAIFILSKLKVLTYFKSALWLLMTKFQLLFLSLHEHENWCIISKLSCGPSLSHTAFSHWQAVNHLNDQLLFLIMTQCTSLLLAAL